MFILPVADVSDHVENVFYTYFRGTYCQNISCHLRETFKIAVVDASNLIMQLAKKLMPALSLSITFSELLA